MRQVVEPDAIELADAARATLATRRDAEELRSLGAYQPGQNEAFDRALALGERLDVWARQRPDERSDLATARGDLREALTPPAPPRPVARARRTR